MNINMINDVNMVHVENSNDVFIELVEDRQYVIGFKYIYVALRSGG